MPRIGPAWLNVNYGNYRGAGGFCFPKDMNALIEFIEKTSSLKPATTVLNAVRVYNRELLKRQGLSEEMVSRHDREVAKVLKKGRGSRKV